MHQLLLFLQFFVLLQIQNTLCVKPYKQSHSTTTVLLGNFFSNTVQILKTTKVAFFAQFQTCFSSSCPQDIWQRILYRINTTLASHLQHLGNSHFIALQLQPAGVKFHFFCCCTVKNLLYQKFGSRKKRDKFQTHTFLQSLVHSG